MKITGTHIHYYFICKTKLWLYHNRVSMEPFNEDVILGRIIEQSSFSREKKNIVRFDDLSIDLISVHDKVIVREIKKSDKMLESAKYQAIYYAYRLIKKGLKVDEIWIHIPRKFKVVKFKWSDKFFSEISRLVANVENIISMKYPLKPERRNVCRKCAFFEFCWA